MTWKVVKILIYDIANFLFLPWKIVQSNPSSCTIFIKLQNAKGKGRRNRLGLWKSEKSSIWLFLTASSAQRSEKKLCCSCSSWRGIKLKKWNKWNKKSYKKNEKCSQWKLLSSTASSDLLWSCMDLNGLATCMILYGISWYCTVLLWFLWQNIDVSGLESSFLEVIDPNSFGLVQIESNNAKSKRCLYKHLKETPKCNSST